MSDETIRDDAADAVVERLLEELARGGELGAGAPGPEARLRREMVELFGLIGAAVEPVEPAPEIKARLLAVAGGSATATQPARPTAPRTAPIGPAPAAEPSRVVPLRPSGVDARPAARRRWALPLAASLAAVLAAFSGYQAVQLAGQRATIDQLSLRLEDLETRTATVAELRSQLADARERMALITGRGVEICALRPMAAESRQANSRGVLYVASDHQHWYLTIEDLMPCGRDRSYQLWFIPAGGEPISAGVFDVGEGSVRVELSSNTMPATTREITVTLEPAGGSPEPTGPAVLHGDEVMAVL